MAGKELAPPVGGGGGSDLPPMENSSLAASSTEDSAAAAESVKGFGKLEFGCKHYRRRCKIRAPCCGEVFVCRHCHNESTVDGHEVQRHLIQQVICLVCNTEQSVSQECSSCGVVMGEYFCGICKFFDDDINKGQYHCADCGICRVGGRDNFFHCLKCGSCYSVNLRSHQCLEDSMKRSCPICFEYLFDSVSDIQVMKCGHTIHLTCFNEMLKHSYTCPFCYKSVIDMSEHWSSLDAEIEAISMPEVYRDRKVWILCNDCSCTSEVSFHFIGHKCQQCRSYNTRSVAPPRPPPQS